MVPNYSEQREVITKKWKWVNILIKKNDTAIKCKLLNFKNVFKDKSLYNKSILQSS